MEIASERKIVKYVELSNTSCFCPIIFEMFGPINDLGLSFLDELGRRITDCTGDARETTHLLQRISVTIQRFDSTLFSWQLCCCIMWEITLVLLSRISPSIIIYLQESSTEGENNNKNNNHNTFIQTRTMSNKGTIKSKSKKNKV